MHYNPAILFSLLQLVSLGTSVPLPSDMVKMKAKVKWMTEQLVIKLTRNFRVLDNVTVNPPADTVDGLSSIVATLEGYNSVISDSLDGVTQIKTEISSLAGFLSRWQQGHCSEQRPKPSVPGPLQELQSRKEFIHTVSREALVRVKEFLKLVLKNLDQLETC
ncbi:leptin-like [Cheilinus undulatus]|uniref:leptin-like n=1 Tax=Cheilinus undulatus TaxID=241271 RepID=UPI001BD42451|nr:leptin-like [Cheilinus undulatus]